MRHALRLVRFGAKLATRGLLAKLGLALAAIASLFFVGRAFVLSQRAVPSAYYLPSIAAGVLVWSAGLLVAFGAARQALARDRKDGTFRLIVGATGSARAYVVSRAFGLVLLLAIVNAGGALVVGAATIATAGGLHAAWLATWALAVSLLYAVSASLVVGLVAFAALGVAERTAGIARLAAVLLFPEIVRRVALSRIDAPAMDVMSISSALTALRESLLPNMVDPGRFVRAAFVLSVVGFAAFAVVRRVADRLTREGA